ncbi:hypothetical protein GCM10009716_39170 [Streptomyces sodiiphilus]|uniref:Lipoprotein n=1 Tax=Streptomyces sodiiphilus TaxID=226217 RepID=A0ABN2PNT2_9ACTN
MTVARGTLMAAGTVLAALTLTLAGCAGPPQARDGTPGGPGEERAETGVAGQDAPRLRAPRLIGDGSTAHTGRQPHQPEARPLDPRRTPPQFVVFSWDGAGEDGNRLFSRFRKAARDNGAHMTYFLSGLYLLPQHARDAYRPPGRSAGASDIGYLRDENIAATIEQLRGAWLDGSEIGTHFNGHFCGADGVKRWSPEDWISETEQAKWMVKNWRTTTGFDHLEPLPFDYESELIGSRTPCLEGRENFLRAARELGLRYDSSGTGRQVWPDKTDGLWDVPLQLVPMPGRGFETLAMDYNFMVNQSGPGSSADTGRRDQWKREMRDGLLAGFQRAYQGNRAPLIIGNHFNDWNGGIYMDAVEEVIEEVCPREDVRCVSFRQLVDWLDAQDPAVLERLRTLGVGERPAGGWPAFLAGRGPSA